MRSLILTLVVMVANPALAATQIIYFDGAEAGEGVIAGGLEPVQSAEMSMIAGLSLLPYSGNWAYWFGLSPNDPTTWWPEGSGVNRNLFIDLPPVTFSAVDRGDATITLTLAIWLNEPSELSDVDFAAFGADGTPIASATGTGPLASSSQWTPLQATWALPAGTRRVVVNFYFGCFGAPAGCDWAARARKYFMDDITVTLTYPEVPFTECAALLLPADTPNGSVSPADFDADGWTDLLVSVSQGPRMILRNNHGTGFEHVSSPTVEGAVGTSFSIGDVDGDGLPDLYNFDGYRVYRNLGGFQFEDSTPALFSIGDAVHFAAWADYDGDGDLDCYSTSGLHNRLLRNDAAAGWTDVTTTMLADYPNWSYQCAWTDYDGDGDMDITYVSHGGQRSVIFRNDGAAGFADATPPAFENNAYGTGLAWGDFDNDGDDDLIMTNQWSPSRLLRNDGQGSLTFVQALPSEGPVQTAYGAAWVDFDNDGDLDVFWNNVDGPTRLFQNDGPGTFVDVTGWAFAESGWSTNSSGSVAWFDYDHDGDMDLFKGHGTDGRVLIYRNNLDGARNWVQVLLHGTISHGWAVGARVRVVTGGVAQFRSVFCGTSGPALGDLPVEFGLGSASTIDTVEVLWPSGIRQVAVGVAGNRRISMVEDAGSTGVEEVPAVNPAVLKCAAAPNPFNPRTTLEFELPHPGAFRLAVYDLAGHRVRVLLDRHLEAGKHSVVWDGSSSSGASVPSGVYLARASVGDLAASIRLVLVR